MMTTDVYPGKDLGTLELTVTDEMVQHYIKGPRRAELLVHDGVAVWWTGGSSDRLPAGGQPVQGLVPVHVSLHVHVSRCRSSGWRPTNPVRSRSGATGAGGPR